MKLKVRDSQPKQMNKRIVLILKIGIFNTHKTISVTHSLPKSEYLQRPCFSLQVALTHKQTNHFTIASSFCTRVSRCSLDNSSCWWLTRSCCLSTNSEIMIRKSVNPPDESVGRNWECGGGCSQQAFVCIKWLILFAFLFFLRYMSL